MRAELTTAGTITAIEGPLLFLRRNVDVGLDEAVKVLDTQGHERLGRIVAIEEEAMIVEVLESTSNLSLGDTRVRFHGEPLHFNLGAGVLGRIFDGVGRPLDGGPPLPAEVSRPIDGKPFNPADRALPQDFIETGISSIDLMNSLVRGQKLPIFSSGGLPHDRIASEIAQNARLLHEDSGEFAIVFVGIGISFDTAENFRATMEMMGALDHMTMFLNLANESSTQRLLTPRFALTAAEHLAFVENRHVLVIMTDMTNYCEALREVSSSRGEIPSRKGYPGYMYSDLATLYERAGCLNGATGTVTQLPILTIPADDISHPIPDLTGYITEGQVVIDRELDHKGIYPPVNVLSSLSRLFDLGTGEGFTHEDHPALAHQLFAAYAHAVRTRLLASVVGREGLTETDGRYLEFADIFENEFINQSAARRFEESMEIAWKILKILPVSELNRLSDAQIETYFDPEKETKPHA